MHSANIASHLRKRHATTAGERSRLCLPLFLPPFLAEHIGGRARRSMRRPKPRQPLKIGTGQQIRIFLEPASSCASRHPGQPAHPSSSITPTPGWSYREREILDTRSSWQDLLDPAASAHERLAYLHSLPRTTPPQNAISTHIDMSGCDIVLLDLDLTRIIVYRPKGIGLIVVTRACRDDSSGAADIILTNATPKKISGIIRSHAADCDARLLALPRWQKIALEFATSNGTLFHLLQDGPVRVLTHLSNILKGIFT